MSLMFTSLSAGVEGLGGLSCSLSSAPCWPLWWCVCSPQSVRAAQTHSRTDVTSDSRRLSLFRNCDGSDSGLLEISSVLSVGHLYFGLCRTVNTAAVTVPRRDGRVDRRSVFLPLGRWCNDTAKNNWTYNCHFQYLVVKHFEVDGSRRSRTQRRAANNRFTQVTLLLLLLLLQCGQLAAILHQYVSTEPDVDNPAVCPTAAPGVKE